MNKLDSISSQFVTLSNAELEAVLASLHEDEQQYLFDQIKKDNDLSLSLRDYIKEAWTIIEPNQPYISGWAFDAISEHLEATTKGDITRLAINVPPGMMKSLQVGVFWPSWEWGPQRKPSYRYLCASHKESLAIRDNLRMRRLVTSRWYQGRYGSHVKITKDQRAKGKFENSETGFRMATAAGGITGDRGDRILIDDPLSVEDARSQVIIENRKEWFLEAIPTRLNNPKISCIILIMQRLKETDTSAIALELGYEHLCLPMEFESNRRCITSIGFSDPRKEEGELLFPERFGRKEVDKLKESLGTYGTAGQLQQRPSPRDGGIFKIDKIREYDNLPESFSMIIQSWDTAFKTKRENDYSCCLTIGVHNGAFYLIDYYLNKIEYPELKRAMLHLWKLYNPVGILVEDKASGQSLIQEMQRPLTDPDDGKIYRLPIKGIIPDVDKEARANACTIIFETMLYFPKNSSWKQRFMDSLAVFPNGAYDDDIDALTQALMFLSKNNKPQVKHLNYFSR